MEDAAPADLPATSGDELSVPAGLDTSVSSLRLREAREIAAQLLRANPPIVAVTGCRGVGIGQLISHVERELLSAGSPMPVRRTAVDPDYSMPFQGAAMDVGISPKEPQVLAIVDEFDREHVGHALIPRMNIVNAVTVAGVGYPQARYVVFLDSLVDDPLGALRAEFDGRLCHIQISEPDEHEVRELVSTAARELAARAGIAISPRVIDAVLRTDVAVSGSRDAAHVLPDVAIDRLDVAIGRARLAHAHTVTPEHLLDPQQAPARRPSVPSLVDVELRLLSAVRGQDAAVATVAERCVASFLGLKGSPHRPRGVFVFCGPTGTGKTRLAKELASAFYGSPDALIRLDMSEYIDAKDASMKLIGASKIWKGSTTDGLLTTRVIQQPRSVLLLDEFEKSHPEIWPLFLQVFDDGRLTDGWGTTADFSNTIIVMTSNLGATADSRTVQEVFPPEFLGRIDEVIRFQPLTREVIREVAVSQLAEAVQRLTVDGWMVDYDDDVPLWLADQGYNPELGARHLERSIDRCFLGPLAVFPGRQLHVGVRVDGGGLAFTPTDDEPGS